MNKIKNARQLREEKKRLQEKQLQHLNEIRDAWKAIRHRPEEIIKENILSAGASRLTERIADSIRKRLSSLFSR
jgi:hypothetical protein